MTELNIVVEGQSDARLLRKYLPNIEGLTPRYFSGDGVVSLATLARNLLVHEEGMVLVVMDSDSLSAENAAQRRTMVMATLRQIAPDERFNVFVFRPEHEIIFFEAPEVLERYWPGEDRLSVTALERGLYAPKEELAKLVAAAQQTSAAWFASLMPEDGELLRKGRQAGQLVKMFEALAAGHLIDA
jgi:hypothetical protein